MTYLTCDGCGIDMTEVDIDCFECHNPLCDNYLSRSWITDED